MEASLNIDYTQSFGGKGNLKGMTFEVVEQVAGRTTLDIFGRHTDFYGMETTIVVEKPTFKNAFLFESMVWLGLFAAPPVLAFLNWKRRSKKHRQATLLSITEP